MFVCECLIENQKSESDQKDLVLTEAELSAGLVEPLSVTGCSFSVTEFKHKLLTRDIQTQDILSGTVHLNIRQKYVHDKTYTCASKVMLRFIHIISNDVII